MLHDRNPIFVQMSDGDIRNGDTLRLLNKKMESRTLELTLRGLPGSTVDVIGRARPAGESHTIEVGPDQTHEVRVLVTEHAPLPASAQSVEFVVTDRTSGETATASDHFRGP